jgi:plastocyanin
MNYKVVTAYVVVILIVAAIAAAIVFKGGFGSNPGSQQQVTQPPPQGVQTPKGEVAALGASPVASSGQVIAPTGQPAKNDVQPGSPQAPQQSNPVPIKDLPPSTIKLTVTASGFSPSSFTVKAGAAVTVSVASGDDQTHVFMMDDPALSALAVGVGPGENRAITFNAPKPGTYNFHCDVPGHAGRGETGKIIVE